MSDLMNQLEEAEALLADGFEDALIGIQAHKGCAVYDANKMIKILMDRDGMDYHEAVEYLDFNTFCAYVGEMTPIYVYLDDNN